MDKPTCRCETCYYFEEIGPHHHPDLGGAGFCYRYPPTTSFLEGEGGDQLAKQPMVAREVDWCGEHRPVDPPPPDPIPIGELADFVSCRAWNVIAAMRICDEKGFVAGPLTTVQELEAMSDRWILAERNCGKTTLRRIRLGLSALHDSRKETS